MLLERGMGMGGVRVRVWETGIQQGDRHLVIDIWSNFEERR